ncbi:MAG: helix-turn-helix transcriptional regulator [Erysipelotrichaceae bacterium]|nr:helix-turn-helix transcriptional regulator [Erysipelotrichaceae bacterium]
MEKEEKIKKTIASNLVYYRKLSNLKQIYVAEKINYSDKAISKWERGEGLPDIIVLYALAEIYGVTINDLLSEKRIRRLPSSNHNKIIVTLLSVGLTWLVSTIAFAILLWLGKESSWINHWGYVPFIYAIPASCIVLLVFNKMWGKRIFSLFIVSGLIWSVALSLDRSLCSYLDWSWLVYIICIPIQVLTLFWYLMRRNPKHGYRSDFK